MGGQIIDATIVAARKSSTTPTARRGRSQGGAYSRGLGGQAGQAPAEGPRCRWTVRYPKADPAATMAHRRIDLAVPAFGYKDHVGIDRRHRLIRTWLATDASRA